MPDHILGAPVLELRDRRIYRLGDGSPTVWLIDDRELGGILVNAPPFSEATLQAIRAVTRPAYLLRPGRRRQDQGANRGGVGGVGARRARPGPSETLGTDLRVRPHSPCALPATA